MTDAELLKFCDFVRNQIGLDFPQKIWGSLRRNLARGAAVHGFGSVAEFARWVTESPGDEKRIDILVGLLTVGETFFFRDQRALEGIERVVVPNIVGTRPEHDKTLRIWSAGCATGEEPYSIAILLKRSPWSSSDRQIRILGTDINKESLEKAKKAFYKEWSFRGVPSWLKKDHFCKVPGGYALDPKIRSMVEFRRLNLVSFDYSSVLDDFGPVDLVLCRNTLMYFTSEVRKRIIEHVLFRLNTQGWLLVSPSEVPHVVHRNLRLVTLPGAIFFQIKSGLGEKNQLVPPLATMSNNRSGPVSQKKDWWNIDELRESQAPASKVSLLPPSVFVSHKQNETTGTAVDLERAHKAFDHSDYHTTINILKNVSSKTEPDPTLLGAVCYLLAKSYANLGWIEEAEAAIEKAINEDKLNVAYHYIYASILQAKELPEKAAERLEKVLFLDPDHIMANISLATLETKLNNKTEALRHIRNAMTLLEGLSPEYVAPDSDGATAAHLREILMSTLATAEEGIG